MEKKNAAIGARCIDSSGTNALKMLRSNTIQWQSEIIGCNRANIFNRNETQDTSQWLRGGVHHLFVRLRDAFKSDRYLMSSFSVELQLALDCLNKRPHFLSAWSIIEPTVCTNWFLCFQFLLWLETGDRGLESRLELVTRDPVTDMTCYMTSACHAWHAVMTLYDV